MDQNDSTGHPDPSDPAATAVSSARELVRDLGTAPERLRALRHQPGGEEEIRHALASVPPKDAARLIRSAIWHKDGAVADTGYAPSPYEDILRRDLLLAARCLGDCEGVDTGLGQEVAEELVAIWCDKDEKGRYTPLQMRAIDALHALREPRTGVDVLGPLIVALNDDTYSVRLAATHGLRQLSRGAARGARALLDAIRNPTGPRFVSAARALAHAIKGSDEAIPLLLEALQQNDTFVRRAVLRALGNLGPGFPQVVQAVADIVRAERGEEWDEAVETLGRVGLGAERALDVLITLLQDEDSTVRISALMALGRAGQDSPRAQLAVFDASEDVDPRVRFTATHVWVGVHIAPDLPGSTAARQTPLPSAPPEPLSPDALQAVRDALNDASGVVRDTAWMALLDHVTAKSPDQAA